MDNNRKRGSDKARPRHQDFYDKTKYSRETEGRDVRDNATDDTRRYDDISGLRRASGAGMRRVSPPPRRVMKNTAAEREVKSVQERRINFSDEKRKRIEAAKRKKRERNMRIKTAVLLVLCASVATVLVCMTPVFDVKQIKLEGNNVVSKAVIEEKVGDLVGENIWRTSKSEIRSRMLEISQISDVTVKKSYIPSEITINITESMPAAYLLSGNAIVVINSDLKIIDDTGGFDTDSLPSLSGISVQSYKLNEPLETDSDEKEEVLRTLLTAFEDEGILSKVTYISLDDLTNIKFNYENRIETLCGSKLELDRKLRMFSQAVSSSSIDANAIGTIDLSVPGQAVYIP